MLALGDSKSWVPVKSKLYTNQHRLQPSQNKNKKKHGSKNNIFIQLNILLLVWFLSQTDFCCACKHSKVLKNLLWISRTLIWIIFGCHRHANSLCKTVACKYCSAMGGPKIFQYAKLQTDIQWRVVSSPWKCRFGIHEICSDLSCGQVICPSPWNTSHHLSALHPSLGARERAPGSTSVLNWVELIEKQRACEWSWGQSMAVACVLSRFQSIWIVWVKSRCLCAQKMC